MIEFSELTTTLLALVAPKETAEGSARLAPVIVTEAPPEDGPVAGLTLVTVGGVT